MKQKDLEYELASIIAVHKGEMTLTVSRKIRAILHRIRNEGIEFES